MRFAEPYWQFWECEIERPQQAQLDVELQEKARRMWHKYVGQANRLRRKPVRWKGDRRR